MIRFGGGKPAKLGKYILSLIVRNSGAAIPNFDAQEASLPATADHDPATSCITHRVGHQIQQNPLKQDRVTAYPGAARYGPQCYSFFVGRT